MGSLMDQDTHFLHPNHWEGIMEFWLGDLHMPRCQEGIIANYSDI